MVRAAVLLACATACDGLLVGTYRAAAPVHRLSAPLAFELGVPSDLQHLHDHVIIEINENPVETQSGILLPTVFETDQDFDVARAQEVRKGTVVAVGPGRANDAGQVVPVNFVKPGDTVILGPFGGTKLQERGKTVKDSMLHLFTVGASSPRPPCHWSPTR